MKYLILILAISSQAHAQDWNAIGQALNQYTNQMDQHRIENNKRIERENQIQKVQLVDQWGRPIQFGQ